MPYLHCFKFPFYWMGYAKLCKMLFLFHFLDINHMNLCGILARYILLQFSIFSIILLFGFQGSISVILFEKKLKFLSQYLVLIYKCLEPGTTHFLSKFRTCIPLLYMFRCLIKFFSTKFHPLPRCGYVILGGSWCFKFSITT